MNMNLEKFSTAMDAVRERFFTIEEFPYLDRSRFPENIIDKAMALPPEALQDFSARLTSKELESILLDLPKAETFAELERVGTILNYRFSSRPIRLFFALYQEHYDTIAMQTIMRRLVIEANRRWIFHDSGSFFWAFGDSGDVFESIKTEFATSWRTLDDFFQAYNVRPDTRLAMEIRIQCFSDAGLAMIHANAKHLVYLLERLHDNELRMLITNYIRVSDVKNCVNAVNLMILERMGEPAKSEKWQSYNMSVVKKFSEWCFYHRLHLHSLIYPKKYEILSKYYVNIVESYELEGSAFVIDFGKIVVVDILNVPYSFFYHKWEFDREMKQWREFEDKPSFYADIPDKPSARDFIIADQDEPCLLLVYEGIDLLYIDEILDIKMGIEPDFRRIKLKSKEQFHVNTD